MDTKISIAGHTFGIYLFFLAYNYYQEKISTVKYGNEAYRSILFPMIINSLGGMLISRCCSKYKKLSINIESNKLLLNYIVLSVLTLVSAHFWNASLSYLTYPTVMISKSCKLLSIALMNFIVFKKKLDPRKYFSVFLTTVSVLLFTFLGKSKSTREGVNLLGIAILIINLSLDGFINVLQDNVFKNYKVSSYNMMYHFNLIRLIISITLIVLTNNLTYSFLFIYKNSEVLKDILISSLLNVLGQLFIYSMIEKHGSMVLSTVNITRKMLSIIISLFLFGHHIEKLQWVAIGGVLFSISLELFESKKKDKIY